jgi:predicted TIM-barrel fold metal-dependent hydrolase
MFVVIHTGHAHIGLYKRADGGDPRAFTPHFDRRTDATFVLAHMNMNEPEVALDVARRRPNVLVDTSWQETRDVLRAAAVLGAERVLLASDYPFGGIARSRGAVDHASLPATVRDLILRQNAIKLLRSRRRTPVAT